MRYVILVAEWPVTRNSDEQAKLLAKQKGEELKGYKNDDLVPFIPYKNICPDDLHLRIRISSKLYNQVRISRIQLTSTSINITILQKKMLHIIQYPSNFTFNDRESFQTI